MSKPMRSKNHPSEKLFRRLCVLVVQNLRLREYLLELDKQRIKSPDQTTYDKINRKLVHFERERAAANRQLNQYGIDIR